MKLRNHQFSTQAQTFKLELYGEDNLELHKPNPPTRQAIDKAKFKDKTYHWNGGVRSGNKRTSK